MYFKGLILFIMKAVIFTACLIWTLRTGSKVKIANLIQFKKLSKSQIGQELMVIAKNGQKMGASNFFVDFGATDGIQLSNSYLLEKSLGWQGICAEPAKIWHKELYLNRKCNISKKAIYSISGVVLDFLEVQNPDLSSLKEFSKRDAHNKKRIESNSYKVESISLNDLLLQFNAPTAMQFLSIDTEGSEYEILKHLDFDKYSFEIIVCEHNFTSSRKLVRELLESNGYVRRFSYISFWDDWYYLLRKD